VALAASPSVSGFFGDFGTSDIVRDDFPCPTAYQIISQQVEGKPITSCGAVWAGTAGPPQIFSLLLWRVESPGTSQMSSRTFRERASADADEKFRNPTYLTPPPGKMKSKTDHPTKFQTRCHFSRVRHGRKWRPSFIHADSGGAKIISSYQMDQDMELVTPRGDSDC
jgi:hypothetical protein